MSSLERVEVCPSLREESLSVFHLNDSKSQVSPCSVNGSLMSHNDLSVPWRNRSLLLHIFCTFPALLRHLQGSFTC